MSGSGFDGRGLAPELDWVFDAPLFMDSRLVEQYYDSIVMPEAKEGKLTIQVGEEQMLRGGVEGGIKAKMGLGSMIGMLFKPEVEASGKLNLDVEGRHGRQRTIEIEQIESPHRQLVYLTAFYQAVFPDRLQFVSASKDGCRATSGTGQDISEDWYSRERIGQSPRPLVFLELSGASGSESAADFPIIPTAAEYPGCVDRVFERLVGRSGQKLHTSYPQAELEEAPTALVTRRNTYWKRFIDDFDAMQATESVESGAREKGCPLWMDYRVPIGPDGSTLHLHLNGTASYPIGTFAYNVIKRGGKHGLRVVGMLKSEPDLNVLAVFER